MIDINKLKPEDIGRRVQWNHPDQFIEYGTIESVAVTLEHIYIAWDGSTNSILSNAEHCTFIEDLIKPKLSIKIKLPKYDKT